MAASNDVIDFTDIDDSGGSGKVRVPEGDYKVKVKAVKFATSQAGNAMFVWTMVGTEGKLKGKELTEYTPLTKKALWKLRDLLEAAGAKVPTKAKVKPLLQHCQKNVVGAEIGVTLEDDEYVNDKGKTFISSKISDYISMDDFDSDADDVEDEDDEDDVEDEDDDDGLDEMDRTELKKHIKSESLDVTVKKSMSDDDLRAAIREASGDDDEDEEEIEDVDLDEL